VIAAFRATITGKTEHRGLVYGDQATAGGSSDLEIGQNLRAMLFDPLLPALGECRRLFLSSDGDLSRLPFEILPTADGGRLIDQYEFSYLSVGRDILRFEAESSGNPTDPLVVADPNFDLAAGQVSESGGTGPLDIEHTAGRRSQDLDRAGFHFSRLPGTRVEGEQIAKMLEATALFDTQALESRLKRYPSPHVLHIATHGFFLPNQKQDPNEAKPGFMTFGGGADNARLDRLTRGLENPLLRSGLALAGANTWVNGGNLPAEAEDALLNGEDVTGLDLLATELVVLSACETGLGEVQVGEGVFGLRRAFVLAGAQTLVMSLWKVPDQQTQELMTDFYRRILAGEPRAKALRQAQLAIKEKHPHPLYWGAFICQGEPGPLNG
jgi:CHAT domain-containing protein